jgi:hypothetical protein
MAEGLHGSQPVYMSEDSVQKPNDAIRQGTECSGVCSFVAFQLRRWTRQFFHHAVSFSYGAGSQAAVFQTAASI